MPVPLRLTLHTTPELEHLLQEGALERATLHAWPLSSVELLTTQTGKRFIYKVQGEPTREPEFLTQALSPLLPACRVLERTEAQAALLFPFIDAPTLRTRALSETEVVACGRDLVAQIGQIGGDPPLYRDLSTRETWRALVDETEEMLARLVASGTFATISPEEVAALVRWTETRSVLASLERNAQLIHGDLKAEHVFCEDDGYRVIDWQRPYRAPGEIDLILLLESLALAPEPHVAPESIGLRWFLLLHWAVEAKTHLLPHLPFFDHWARGALDQIQTVAQQGATS